MGGDRRIVIDQRWPEGLFRRAVPATNDKSLGGDLATDRSEQSSGRTHRTTGLVRLPGAYRPAYRARDATRLSKPPLAARQAFR